MLRMLLVSLALVDLVGGVVTVVWPGLWQEILHPLAVGTTFYHLQRTGAVWLARSALTFWAVGSRDPRSRLIVASLWAVEIPAELLMVVRLQGAGPIAEAYHLVRAVAVVPVCLVLRRAACGMRR